MTAEMIRPVGLLATIEHELMAGGHAAPHHMAHVVVKAMAYELFNQHRGGLVGTALAEAERLVAVGMEASYGRDCSLLCPCSNGCGCQYCTEARSVPGAP